MGGREEEADNTTHLPYVTSLKIIKIEFVRNGLTARIQSSTHRMPKRILIESNGLYNWYQLFTESE